MSDRNKEIVEELNKVIRENNLQEFLSFFIDDVQWTKVGDKAATGKEEVGKLIKSLGDAPPPSTITFEAMIAEDDYSRPTASWLSRTETENPLLKHFAMSTVFEATKLPN